MFPETKPTNADTNWIVTAMEGHTQGRLLNLDILQEEYNLDDETVALLAEHFKDQLEYLESVSPDSSAKDILEGMILPLVE